MSDEMNPTSDGGDDDVIDAAIGDRVRDALLADETRQPPADTIDRIREAARARQTTVSPQPEVAQLHPSPRRVASWNQRTLLAVAAAAVVVGGLLGALLVGSFTSDSRVEEALRNGVTEYDGTLQGGDLRAEIEVVRTGVGRVITISTSDLEILPTGEFYEVWFVAAAAEGDSAPVRISVGTFHPDEFGVSDVILTGAVDPALLPVIEVTAEPADGDPRPGGPVVLSTTIG